MKFLFIAVLILLVFKLIWFKNIKNKPLYIAFCGMTVLMGIINLLFEPSIADILKRWM